MEHLPDNAASLQWIIISAFVPRHSVCGKTLRGHLRFYPELRYFFERKRIIIRGSPSGSCLLIGLPQTGLDTLQMQWNCKHCVFSENKRGLLLKHYRLKHGGFTRQRPIPETKFNRLVTTDLQSNVYGAVDRYTPRFVTIFKSKKGTVGETLDELMQQMNTWKEADVTAMRTLVLRGLPILLGVDAINFYNTCNACDVDGWPQVSVGVLTVIDEEDPLIPNKLYLDRVSTAVIVEGGIVLDNLHNLPQAICILFGLSYALNLKYPKGMINTFKSLFCLGQNKLPPKLQSLKNLLLS
ncbi:uncharacterized protein LOC111949096 isoform X1 [Oryzias latipes]